MRRLRFSLVVGALALGIGAALVSSEAGALGFAIADVVVGWVLVGCGVVATQRRGGGRVAVLLAATGLAWLAGSVVPEALYLHRGPLVHLLLSYPSGRLARGPAQAVVAAAYLDGAIEPIGHNAVVTLLLFAATLTVAVTGYVGAVGPRRRARAISTAGTAAVVGVLGLGAVSQLAGWGGDAAILVGYECALVAIALGLLADLRRDWSQAAVTGLVVDLGENWEPLTLCGRLARALGDPSLELGYWLGPGQGYTEEGGRPLALPDRSSGRMVTSVEAEGERVAVLVHDRSVLDDPKLVETVAAATRLAVTNVRLEAEVLAHVEQLAASRRRIVEVADAQRRRLQNELSDGAERRLAAVGSHVAALADVVEGRRATELLLEVEGQLQAAAAELRERARGIHPTALTAGGLGAALPQLVGRAGLPVELRVDGARYPGPVEAAGYFVCAEGLTNVAKYAAASAVRIEVRRQGRGLAVAITDNGVGGADPERGSGLRGLADRVEALGGQLTVTSSRGEGTRLVAEIPATL
jgi:signal transduction histidine kinase